MKTLSEMTKEDIENAVTLSESEDNYETINVDGFILKRLDMTGDEYAKIRGAKPITDCLIYKVDVWIK